MASFPWLITGTEQQQAITRKIVDAIKFPWHLLTIQGTPEFGWRDLNSGNYSSGELGHHNVDANGDHYEVIQGKLNGRNFIFGVYYPGLCIIYLDVRLVGQYEHYAIETGSAELAHAVDEDLLTDKQRYDIMLLHHNGVPCVDNHSWWEKYSYSAEYDDLLGESFMIDFTYAYSDLGFSNANQFTHNSANVDPAAIRKIIGIERTDAAPTPAPIPAPTPNPTHHHTYVVLGKSKIVHKSTHYDETPRKNMQTFDHMPEGFRACKVCKPH